MSTRKLWLLDQIEKCDELLESDKLTEFQRAMVTILRLDFLDSMRILKDRGDDGEGGDCRCTNVIHLPRKRG